MKANYKVLKAILALEIKKLGPFSFALKLGKFPLFDDSFFDLAGFWDLNNFLVFDNFLYFSINLSSPSTLPTLSAASILLVTNNCDNTHVFSIDVSCVAILLKFWMNCK